MNVLTTNTLAQLAHVGWGGLLGYILLRYVPRKEAALFVAVGAFLKELVETLGLAFWESKQTAISSAEDFAFWIVGIAVFLFFTRKKNG